MIKMDESAVIEKICTVCSEPKPESEYYRDKTKADGRKLSCKTCDNISQKTRRDRRRQREAEETKQIESCKADIKKGRTVPFTWQHVDSIIQQIGETENQITAERMERNRRILQAKDESDRTIRSLNRRQVKLFGMLEKFARVKYIGGALLVKELRHGRVRIAGGEVEIEPFLDKVKNES